MEPVNYADLADCFTTVQRHTSRQYPEAWLLLTSDGRVDVLVLEDGSWRQPVPLSEARCIA